MTAAQVRRARKTLEELKLKPKSIKPRELISLVQSLGFNVSNRGKEPVYEKEDRPYPIAIPNHPGDLAVGTAKNILKDIEREIEHEEDRLP